MRSVGSSGAGWRRAARADVSDSRRSPGTEPQFRAPSTKVPARGSLALDAASPVRRSRARSAEADPPPFVGNSSARRPGGQEVPRRHRLMQAQHNGSTNGTAPSLDQPASPPAELDD